MTTHSTVREVTDRIRERSRALRADYLARLAATRQRDRGADRMGCANVAHALAALPANDKFTRRGRARAQHRHRQRLQRHAVGARAAARAIPDLIKDEARRLGATAQVAGGVPAMCDGVTQGTPGMELSLFTRDVIAMGTAVALSHDVFDAALMLGVCDKIVPGLLIGALHFGHLPTVFVPGGPDALGPVEQRQGQGARAGGAGPGRPRRSCSTPRSQAYHAPGTCTFYGTANSNQMLLEAMGLHVPGTAFVHPGDGLREELTREAVRTVLGITCKRKPLRADRRSWSTSAPSSTRWSALLATGGSTNHLIHWVAVARVGRHR